MLEVVLIQLVYDTCCFCLLFIYFFQIFVQQILCHTQDVWIPICFSVFLLPPFISPSCSHAAVHRASGVCSRGLECKPFTTCGREWVYWCIPPGLWWYSRHSQGCPYDQSKTHFLFFPSLLNMRIGFKLMAGCKSISYVANARISSSLICVIFLDFSSISMSLYVLAANTFYGMWETVWMDVVLEAND